MSDLISRKWLMECVDEGWIKFDTEKDKNIYVHLVRDIAPSAQPEQPERCSDCEWWTNQPEIIRCKDCKHFHYDMPYVVQGIPVLGHEVCDFWGDGCKTNENGFCSYAERREDE